MVFIIGLSGIFAQVVLFRQLLVTFYGNELILGIQLACWLVLESAGVFLAGRFLRKTTEEKILKIFFICQLVFILGFILSILICRLFKPLLKILPGQMVSLSLTSLCVISTLFLTAFFHGVLFSSACAMFYKDRPTRVYFWETAGTIVGGISVTLLLLIFNSNLLIAFLVGLLNLLAMVFLFKNKENLKLEHITKVIIAFLVFVGILGVRHLDKWTLEKQLGISKIIFNGNSVYGNVILVQNTNQRTVFYNGVPFIVLPNFDIETQEKFAVLPLAFLDKCKRILLIENGWGGLLQLLLKIQDIEIDYFELDSLPQKLLTLIAEKNIIELLNDRRLHIFRTDARKDISKSKSVYDVILIGSSQIHTLVSNRFFTEEFFALTKKHLSSGGIIALRIPSSEVYLNLAQRKLAGSIIGALKKHFNSILVIPGSPAIIVASESRLLNLTDSKIFQRITEKKIPTQWLTEQQVKFLLDARKRLWWQNLINSEMVLQNTDFRPYAVFQSFLLWSSEQGDKLAKIIIKVEQLYKKVWLKFFFITSIFFILLMVITARKSQHINISFAVFITGFWGMFLNIMLLFIFQIFFGAIYFWIGILISSFMLGSALAAILFEKVTFYDKMMMRIITLLESLLLVIVLAVCNIVSYLSEPLGVLLFGIILFLIGFCVGSQFALAVNIFRNLSTCISEKAAKFYALDILGATFASFLASLILIPLVGVLGCLWFLAFLIFLEYLFLVY
ncbi:MAG: hypothetical protein N2606_06990 [Candidatus Omnitrophica bacterium]|nr:hypothetical protein [Candidatus Omnitrophota bacterium]